MPTPAMTPEKVAAVMANYAPLAASGLSIAEAAEKMGMKRQTLSGYVNRYAPAVGSTPPKAKEHPPKDVATDYLFKGVAHEGHAVKGVSTLYGADGAVRAQWVKSTADQQDRERGLREFAESLAEGVKGLAPITPAPLHVNEDLMCVIPIGDPHFGLKVWAQEGGANFDLEIAEQMTCSAIDRLLASAPKAKTALLLNLGDHFHADSQSNTTTAGTTVDVDGRWAKIQQVGLRATLYCIQRLLERHERVIVRINRGNHDKHSAYALSLMVSCYFHNEPRVEVDLSPAAYWYMDFGKVLIASTHGDTVKGDKLMGIMAVDRPELWGSTKHRYWFVGHVHHSDIKEYPGGVVEYFRTLAPGDAWHHGQGYRSGRDMRLVVMHREFGEVERHRCDIGMLDATQSG